MNKKLDTIKKFFLISNAAFEYTKFISGVLGNNVIIKPTHMSELHKLALVELEKENPSIDYLDSLLKQMENLAEENSAKNNTGNIN